VIDGTVVVVIA